MGQRSATHPGLKRLFDGVIPTYGEPAFGRHAMAYDHDGRFRP
jgi:hypothetical protein